MLWLNPTLLKAGQLCRELTCSVQSSPQAISASPFHLSVCALGDFLLSNLIHAVPIARDGGWKVPEWEEITALSCYFFAGMMSGRSSFWQKFGF